MPTLKTEDSGVRSASVISKEVCAHGSPEDGLW